MLRSILTALVILSVCMVVYEARADEFGYRGFTEIGGMNVNENGVSEGHKSYHQFGLEWYGENLRSRVSAQVDGFFMGEPAEEDPEIPKWGAGVQAEYGFKVREWAIPYLGVRYDHIERGVAPKYEDPNDTEYQSYKKQNYAAQVESQHDIVSARGGVHFRYKWMYADL